MLHRRRQWFVPMAEAYTALWWIPRGSVPTTADAEERVHHLRIHGPTRHAFTLRVHFPPLDDAEQAPQVGRGDWLCPA